MTKRAAIILSGGKSERFQSENVTWQDKALFEFLGKPLLIHAVENVQNFVEETVIIVNDENRKDKYSKLLTTNSIDNIRLLIDEKIDNLGGPLVAILTGLKSVEAEYCLTLPCDMPRLQQKVIEYLFKTAKDSLVVVPMWPNGRMETLTMVLERKSTLKIANLLCHLKRPRSDDIIRGVLKVLFVSTVGELAALDPELKSFVNINNREDLTRLQPRRVQGPVTENTRLDLGSLSTVEIQSLQDGIKELKEKRFTEAAKIFAFCASKLEKEKQFFWAAISRENEGKSLLKQTQRKRDQASLVGHVPGGKKALMKAVANYELEADMHERNGYFFLAERARSDKAWCEAYFGRL